MNILNSYRTARVERCLSGPCARSRSEGSACWPSPGAAGRPGRSDSSSSPGSHGVGAMCSSAARAVSRRRIDQALEAIGRRLGQTPQLDAAEVLHPVAVAVAHGSELAIDVAEPIRPALPRDGLARDDAAFEFEDTHRSPLSSPARQAEIAAACGL